MGFVLRLSLSVWWYSIFSQASDGEWKSILLSYVDVNICKIEFVIFPSKKIFKFEFLSSFYGFHGCFRN